MIITENKIKGLHHEDTKDHEDFNWFSLSFLTFFVPLR